MMRLRNTEIFICTLDQKLSTSGPNPIAKNKNKKTYGFIRHHYKVKGVTICSFVYTHV
jgi:hypothetical protein